MTIVTGLNDAQRLDMAKRVRNAIVGADVGFEFTVDIGGQVQPLTRASVEGLGITNIDVANSLVVNDIPGVRSALDIAFPELAVMRRNLAAALDHLESAQDEHAKASKSRSAVDPDVLRAATNAYEEAQDELAVARTEVDRLAGAESVEDRQKQLDRTEGLLGMVRDRVKVLRVALDRKSAAPEDDTSPKDQKHDLVTMQNDLASALLDHQDVSRELSMLRRRYSRELADDAALNELQLAMEQLSRAEEQVDDLGERLDELQKASHRMIDPDPHRMQMTHAALLSTQDEVDRIQQSIHEIGSDEDIGNDVDVTDVDFDDAEFYLFARIANLRQLADGEAVPLVIDAAFDRFDTSTAVEFLNLMTSVSSSVQIIYFASNSTAQDWAGRQDEVVVACVGLERV